MVCEDGFGPEREEYFVVVWVIVTVDDSDNCLLCESNYGRGLGVVYFTCLTIQCLYASDIFCRQRLICCTV